MESLSQIAEYTARMRLVPTLWSGPPLSLTLMMAFTCCALGSVIAILVFGLVLARGKSKEPPDSGDDSGRKEQGTRH